MVVRTMKQVVSMTNANFIAEKESGVQKTKSRCDVSMEPGISAVCAACLCVGRALRDVMASPYEEFFKLEVAREQWSALELRALRVCWECAAVLRRIARFHEQVELSFRRLRDFLATEKVSPTDCNISVISEPPKLKICIVENISLPQNNYDEIELIKVKLEGTVSDSSDTEFKDEDIGTLCPQNELAVDSVKTETEDNNAQKVKIKKHKKKLKKKYTEEMKLEKKVKKLKKKFLNNVNCDDTSLEDLDQSNSKGRTKSGKERLRRSMVLDPEKIKKIVLTREELLLERAGDARSEAYLKLPHKCETCIQGFDHEETLSDHIERKHNSALGKYQCATCKSVLSSQASYSTHCRRHLLRFECAACGKRTVDKGAMLKHYGSEHEARVTEYTCRTCGAVSESYRAHRYHKEKHQEKPQCEDCGKTFTNKNSLRCHILNMHRATRSFPCRLCEKTYRGKSGLLMHMASHDARAPLAYCAPCRTHFKTPYNYHHHVRTSRKHRTEDDLTFVCEACEARFLTARQLREHVAWEHLKTSEHQCLQCNKRFKHRVGLERHRKFVHEKQRPPRNKMCHHCGRGFTTASILRAHIRTHTGERPLSCDTCPATFSHSAALYTHNKLVHLKAACRRATVAGAGATVAGADEDLRASF